MYLILGHCPVVGVLGSCTQVPPGLWTTATFVRHWLLEDKYLGTSILHQTHTFWMLLVVVSVGTAPVGGVQANNPLMLEGCPLLMLLLGGGLPPASLLPGIGTARVPGIGTARPKLGTTSS